MAVKRVLLIEDEADIAELLALVLEPIREVTIHVE